MTLHLNNRVWLEKSFRCLIKHDGFLCKECSRRKLGNALFKMRYFVGFFGITFFLTKYSSFTRKCANFFVVNFKTWAVNVANILINIIDYSDVIFHFIFIIFSSMYSVHLLFLVFAIKASNTLHFTHAIILVCFEFLAVPPDRPIIYETKRKERAKNVEAYNEGTDILLICEVTGGKY